MRTCALTHGLGTECQCPVVQSGGERECTSNAGCYSEQVNEAAVRVQHFCLISGGKVSPNCYSSPFQLWKIPYLVESDDEDEETAVPEYENDLMVVSRKIGHVFSEKLRKPTREFAEMAKPLETEKVYDLSWENGLLTVDSGATSTLTRT
jgi:hypothetical protein